MAVEETGPASVPEAPPPASPDVSGRNDFAASAAMVNDILAARPAGDTPVAATTQANRDRGVAQASDREGGHPSGMAAGSDFFASAKSKKLSGKPFWQRQFTLRRSRTGSR